MIKPIEQKQIDDNSVGKLSTRPNAPSAMGGNGLDAAQLRARFDALAKLAIDKINELLAYLNGDELKDGTTAPSFASLIKFTGDDGVEYTLEGILDALQDGEFFPVDTEYTPGSNYPQSGKAVKEVYDRLQAFTTQYANAKFNTALGLYESVAADLESAEQRIEEVDQQSQQRTEQAKQELVDYVDEALKDIDVDVTVDQTFSPSSPNAQSGKAVAQAMKRATDDAAVLCSSTVSAHNTSSNTHNDIRLLISELQSKINAFFDVSDDNGKIDRLVEIVAYLNSNKELIDAITTSKVSVDAIADNLTTNDPKKVLSAKQGMVIKQEIKGVEEQIPLVLPYVFEWGKTDEIKVGDENSVAVKYFNRIPKPRTEEYEGDRFFGYFYTTNSHKHYHVSAVVTEVRDNIQPDNAIKFEIVEVVQFIPTVDQTYQPTSTNPQSGKAVAEAIAAVPKEVHNITSIDDTYETVDSLPSGESNGTTYLVVYGNPEDTDPSPSLYAYNGTTWGFRAQLKPHTLYCVLTGKNSGIYRYTMSSPYLVLAEQAVEERANQRFSNAATAHKEGTLVAITDISPITHGVRVWDKANPDSPVSVYLSENEYKAGTSDDHKDQNTEVDVLGDGSIQVRPVQGSTGTPICKICEFTAETSGTYYFSFDFYFTGTAEASSGRIHEIFLYENGTRKELLQNIQSGENVTLSLTTTAGSLIKISFYLSQGAGIFKNYLATFSNIFIATSAEEKEVIVEAGGTVSSMSPGMAIIAKDTSTTLCVEYNRDINKVEAGLKSYIERLLGVIENGTY